MVSTIVSNVDSAKYLHQGSHGTGCNQSIIMRRELVSAKKLQTYQIRKQAIEELPGDAYGGAVSRSS
jgi:hypothetical protein